MFHNSPGTHLQADLFSLKTWNIAAKLPVAAKQPGETEQGLSLLQRRHSQRSLKGLNKDWECWRRISPESPAAQLESMQLQHNQA